MRHTPRHFAPILLGIAIFAACHERVVAPSSYEEAVAVEQRSNAASGANLIASPSIQYLAIFGAQTNPDLVASLPGDQRSGASFPDVDAPFTEHCIAYCGFLADGSSIFDNVKPIIEVETQTGRSAVWQSSKLSGQHPWGFLELSPDFPTPASGNRRTNSWINYRSNDESVWFPDSSYHRSYRYRVAFNVPDFPTDADGNAIDASMVVKMKVDNWGAVWINGTRIPGVIAGESHSTNGLLGTAEFKRAVRPGRNTIELVVSDGGGLAGFTFLVELTMQASGPLTQLPVGIIYTSTGFAPPVSNTQRNTVVGGSVVPLKFQLTRDGAIVSDRTALSGSPVVTSCGPGPTTNVPGPSLADLQYLAGTRQFVLPWRVPRELGCHTVTVNFVGGGKISADFEVRR